MAHILLYNIFEVSQETWNTKHTTVYDVSWRPNVNFVWIQTAKLAYPTYAVPDTIQPRLVLKGIPTNFPVDKIQTGLTPQEIEIVKISQITKTDKVTQTLITKYPVFVVSFQPGTDINEVLQFKKVCHNIMRKEKHMSD